VTRPTAEAQCPHLLALCSEGQRLPASEAEGGGHPGGLLEEGEWEEVVVRLGEVSRREKLKAADRTFRRQFTEARDTKRLVRKQVETDMNRKDGDEWWWIGEKSVDERSLRPHIGHSGRRSLRRETRNG